MSQTTINDQAIDAPPARGGGGVAAALVRGGAPPESLAAGVVLCAVIAGALLAGSGQMQGAGRAIVLIVVAAVIQLRMYCGRLSRAVAAESAVPRAAWPIWNALPDRIADALFFIGAGYGAASAGIGLGQAAGWAAAALAILAAYVLELARALDQPAPPTPPAAAAQRMALLTGAVLISAAEPLWGWRGQTLAAACLLIAAGTAIIIGLRTRRLAERLRG